MLNKERKLILDSSKCSKYIFVYFASHINLSNTYKLRSPLQVDLPQLVFKASSQKLKSLLFAKVQVYHELQWLEQAHLTNLFWGLTE